MTPCSRQCKICHKHWNCCIIRLKCTRSTEKILSAPCMPQSAFFGCIVRSRFMIVIVSGLPRSGTSLMMQMLQAGGMSLLIDDQRPADADNPNGYWEYEQIGR